MAKAGGKIGVGLIGFGTIGTGVAKLLKSLRAELGERLGARLELVRVADLDLRSDRGIKLPKGVLIRDAHRLIADPEVQIVVELIGGIEPARSFHLEALRVGKAVVSANKALLSEHGAQLARAAEKAGVAYGFEASVCGGIPIIRTLKEALAGDSVREVYGILNGTANYVLSKMAGGGGEFAEVLAEAQAMGLAEADPTYDVDGLDSLHKLVVLVALAFGKRIRPKSVSVEGIRNITGVDMSYAREFGYAIKLLAVARDTGDGVEAHVQPTMVPGGHLLAQVSGPFNAVCVRSAALGTSIYYGQGAGMMPTATAVVADVIEAARSIKEDIAPTVLPYGRPVSTIAASPVMPIGEVSHEHYIRFQLRDEPGVLAGVASALAAERISIATVVQRAKPSRGVVPVVVRTHRSREAALRRALARVVRKKGCRGRPMVIRVEEELGEQE